MHKENDKTQDVSLAYTIIGAFTRRIYRCISGLVVFLKLVRTKDKDTHFLVVPDNIGDGLLAFAYLKEYKKQHKIGHVTVICSAKIKQLCAMYHDTIDEIVVYPKGQIYNLGVFVASYVGKAMYANERMNPSKLTDTVYVAYINRWSMIDNAYFAVADVYRNLIYKIGNDAPLERPRIPKVDIEGLVEKYALLEGRTVLLNPYAVSVIRDVMHLFEKLASALKERGYKCVTVTANSEQRPVEGTAALECDLATACNLAAYCGYAIGMRSGFMDLMAFVDCKLIAIDSCYYPRAEFWKIEKCWGAINPNCHSVVHGDDENVTLQAVLKLVDAY